MRSRSSLLLSALAIVMLVARVSRTGSLDLAFLGWNLVLAWAPVAPELLTRGALARDRLELAVPAALAWWLFFPNAIYLVTDLVYAGHGPGALRWYDAVMCASFAFAGATIAIGSLERMRCALAERTGERASWMLAAIVWLSSGVGVWLGRVQRWNSWDVITDPLAIARDAAHLVLAPRAHLGAWVVALTFAALLAVLQLGAREARTLETR
ncbi:DUF1361 domain-containing protein [Sandaracinus amylolyticus]|uniref:DUF1361 domain-containing protein n=1 Tax=Sandaracinus amylolyticus TaxID=927083 RepID=UPI001F440B76|nr:DUF1361 domain-containing protein [Sandaracinus amylolyticus]